MSQFLYDEEPSHREEVNGTRASDRAIFCVDMTGTVKPEHHSRNQTIEPLQSSTMSRDPSDWVPIDSSDFGDELCRTLSTDYENVCPVSSASSHFVPSPGNDPNSDAMKLAVALVELKVARGNERYNAMEVKVLEREAINLKSDFNKERAMSISLGAKLLDVFIMVTQNQQHELDRVQRRLLDLQDDAENCLLTYEWRNLQEKLHNINRKLDGYIKRTTPQSIASGTQTDELKLFLAVLYADVPKMWKELRQLNRNIEDEKAKDAEDKARDCEAGSENVPSEQSTREDVDSADAFDQPSEQSVTDILDRYYEFSRFHRERMVTRQERLQALMKQTSIELNRLRADVTYEEGRTTNMRTRMAFWGDDVSASKVKSSAMLLDNLDMKLSALKCGAEELEDMARIIRTLPLHLHMIDINTPEEGEPTTSKEASTSPGPSDSASAAGQREDTLYIAELEAKLKEKQANEKAWAAHFEHQRQRENEAKAELEAQLMSSELRNAELQRVVGTVSGKLFEHRERFWGLSGPARKMGEELITALEQLEITCDEPSVYGYEGGKHLESVGICSDGESTQGPTPGVQFSTFSR
ncbi:hypothetical protein GGS24DRAFT_451775 [Hypoxylon argillaceum]|nr:hypothetical protein GGS24DRAFT_451775 [Hypoxylon argillaceum]